MELPQVENEEKQYVQLAIPDEILAPWLTLSEPAVFGLFFS